MTYKQLIDIIKDPTARDDEVDDAIIDLGDYAEEEVIIFLISISWNILEDYILSSIGESIGQIFINDNRLYLKYGEEIKNLPAIIQREVGAILESN